MTSSAEQTTPEQLLREGKPNDALLALQQLVREQPESAKLRVFLFQLLTVMGRWEKALTQLNVAAEMDSQNLLMAQVCRAALACEALRGGVFAGKRTPLVFGQPADWVGWLVQATHLVAAGKWQQAGEMRDRAFDAAPTISGEIDGKPFEWIADADQRLGPILEAIVDGRYFWIPLSNVHRITIDEPADLRDVVWLPAQFIWKNGGTAVGLIPTRYPGSELSEDAGIVLARKTEWTEPANAGMALGLGQRVFATDGDEYPLLQARQITIGEPPAHIQSDRDEATLELQAGEAGSGG